LLRKVNSIESTKKRSSVSWTQCTLVLGVVVAAVAVHLSCYAQLVKEQRNCKDLREQLLLMNELVEKLEVERAAEYQKRLDEASKQIADDMSADIALARKEA
uniref:PLVAP protein n=1 Tax=Heligmosomoides polygyrus TaxID=6339 RepID=A0A183GNL8_HELPZ